MNLATRGCAASAPRPSAGYNGTSVYASSSDSRMLENRRLFDFYLAKQEMDMIDSLNVNRRYNDPGAFCEAAFGTFCPIYE